MADGIAMEPPAKRQALPAAGYLTTLQASNWIALGQALDADLTGAAEFRKMWFYQDDGGGWPSDGRHPYLVAIEAIKAGHSEWPVRMEDSVTLTRLRRGVFTRAVERLAELGVSADALEQILLIHMKGCHDRRRATIAARGQLLAAMESGRLLALGTPVANGAASTTGAVPIPEHFFASPGVWLDSAGALGTLYGTAYVSTRMRAADVTVAFPLTAPQPPSGVVMPSGFAGRPSSRAAVEQEMRRRFAAGEAEGKGAAEARYLSEWLSRHHPSAPQATAKVIAGNIAELFRALDAERRKSST